MPKKSDLLRELLDAIREIDQRVDRYASDPTVLAKALQSGELRRSELPCVVTALNDRLDEALADGRPTLEVSRLESLRNAVGSLASGVR